MTEYNGQDGLARNITKLRVKASEWAKGMRPHIDRSIKHPDVHAYVNLWVEACRVGDGYFFGHVLAVLFPLWIIREVVGYFYF